MARLGGVRASISDVTIRIADDGVQVGDQFVELPDKPLRFLELLMEHAGEVITPRMLFESLYEPYEPLPEVKIFDVMACRIRKRIGVPEVAHAIWGRGYRFGYPNRKRTPIPDAIVKKSLRDRIFATTGLDLYSLKDLPPHEGGRWTSARKAAIIELVGQGAISVEDLMGHYPDLSMDEFEEWTTFYLDGLSGLRVTQVSGDFLRHAA